MRRYKALHVSSSCSIGSQWTTCQHHLQNMKKLFSDLEIRLVAGVMKGNQNFVRKAPAIPRRPADAGFPARIILSLAHRHP